MAETIRFTIPILRNLVCPPGKSRVFFQDAMQPELLFQVTNKGSKNYYARAWNPLKRYTEKKPIGKFKQIELREARKQAREMAALVARGNDPDAQRKAQQQDVTFAEAYRSFIADPVKRRKRGPRRIATVEGYAHQYSRHIESWLGSRRLSAIHATDIDRFHSSVGKHIGPYAANRAISLISSVFNDAILKGWHGENPANGIQRFPEPSRTRFLQEDEIGPFIRACEAARTTRLRTVAEIVLLALLSGLRRRNVCRARWEQIDFDRRVWNIPADEMKNGEPHSVYLCDYLHQMLMARYRDRNGSVWVFSSTRAKGPLMEPKKGLARIVEQAKINPQGIHMHCLKHTFLTYADDLGLPSAVRKRLAAHKRSGDVTDGYTHALERRVREAYERVAQHMLRFANEEVKTS